MKKNNESGRSMVEMLGVLAIIGVLSVAGITGYTTAMNSHRANEAVNNATRLAMLLSSKRLSNPNATLTDELTGTGFQISDAKDKIELSVSVPDAVKSRIEGMRLTTSTLDTTTPGKITFTFNNDLSERISGSQTDGNIGGSGQQQEDSGSGIVKVWTSNEVTSKQTEVENSHHTCNNDNDCSDLKDMYGTSLGICDNTGKCQCSWGYAAGCIDGPQKGKCADAGSLSCPCDECPTGSSCHSGSGACVQN